MRGQKKSLNTRRLTKKQVATLIASEGEHHPDYTARLEHTYRTGSKSQPQVYSLPGSRILYVHDDIGSTKGRGDIYPAEYFARFVRWVERVRDPSIPKGSVDHWYHFSRHKASILGHESELVNELEQLVGCALDGSYGSLDAVSAFAEAQSFQDVIAHIYDHLVIYAGVVLMGRVRGSWHLEQRWGRTSPFVKAADGRVLMPINVVWENLDGLDPIDLRRSAANEVRRTAAKRL
ncbi:MAG: hypothetical protein AAFX41_06670 [Bacteroidota bacterium]